MYTHIVQIDRDRDSETYEEVLSLMDGTIADAAINYLSDWDYGDSTDVINALPKNPTTEIFRHKDYVLVLDEPHGWMNLYREVKDKTANKTANTQLLDTTDLEAYIASCKDKNICSKLEQAVRIINHVKKLV